MTGARALAIVCFPVMNQRLLVSGALKKEICEP